MVVGMISLLVFDLDFKRRRGSRSKANEVLEVKVTIMI